MTIYTAPEGDPGYPIPKPSIAGVNVTQIGKFEVDNAFNPGDVIRMCRIPLHSVILSGWLYGSNLDGATQGNETFGLTIGWEYNGVEDGNPSGLGNLGVLDPYNVTGYKQGAEGYCYPLQGELLSEPLIFRGETVITLTITNSADLQKDGSLTLLVSYVQHIELHP